MNDVGPVNVRNFESSSAVTAASDPTDHPATATSANLNSHRDRVVNHMRDEHSTFGQDRFGRDAVVGVSGVKIDVRQDSRTWNEPEAVGDAIRLGNFRIVANRAGRRPDPTMRSRAGTTRETPSATDRMPSAPGIVSRGGRCGGRECGRGP